jgi:pyruvate/2-oxoglutarate dehydrogenase complex dihydrolipoamide acyltransferase (E2) component
MKWWAIMRTPIVLPDLGAAQVRLSLWFSKPGDLVFEGDRLVEVVVSGATFDVSAPATGRLIEYHVWPRDLLTPGQVLGLMESENPESISDAL